MQKVSETKKVARNTKSWQKVAKQLVESPRGFGGCFHDILCKDRLNKVEVLDLGRSKQQNNFSTKKLVVRL